MGAPPPTGIWDDFQRSVLAENAGRGEEDESVLMPPLVEDEDHICIIRKGYWCIDAQVDLQWIITGMTRVGWGDIVEAHREECSWSVMHVTLSTKAAGWELLRQLKRIREGGATDLKAFRTIDDIDNVALVT